MRLRRMLRLVLAVCLLATVASPTFAQGQPGPATGGGADYFRTVGQVEFATVYAGPDVTETEAQNALTAIRQTWARLPAEAREPLPSGWVGIYVLGAIDEQQPAVIEALRRRGVGEVVGCFAYHRANERTIVCESAAVRSDSTAVVYLAHEVAHELVWRTVPDGNGAPTWLHEGLSEWAGSEVLQQQSASANLASWTEREQLVRRAIAGGTAPNLADLTEPSAWRSLADSNLAYSYAAVAVRRAMEASDSFTVLELSRSSAAGAAWQQEFTNRVGISVQQLETDLRAQLAST